MTISAHVAVGSVVGLATGNPVAAFFAAWISHHVLDLIPHSDIGSVGGNIENILNNKKQMQIVFADIFLCALIFLFIAFKADFNQLVLWGACGGAFPDLVDNSPYWSAYTRKIFPTNYFHILHEKIHCTIVQKEYFFIGVLTQIIVVALSFYLLYAII